MKRNKNVKESALRGSVDTHTGLTDRQIVSRYLGRNQIIDEIKKDPDAFREMLEHLEVEDPVTFGRAIPQIRDSQTGLYQKYHLEGVLLPTALEQAMRENAPLSYVLIDLDGIHNLNRKYGQSVGDNAINAVGDSYRSAGVKGSLDELVAGSIRRQQERRHSRGIRDTERREFGRRQNNYQGRDYASQVIMNGSVAGRVGGGEEFAIILYGCSEQKAIVPVQRLLDAIRISPISGAYGSVVKITASAGITQYENGLSLEEFKRRAEIAMRYSKYNGKNRVTIFSAVPSTYIPIIQERT